MIKIENIVTPSSEQWEAVVRGVRNPFNSWGKSDSKYDWNYENAREFKVGENDLTLMKRLANAGDDHGKFMRMLPVIVDITAPTYWLAELDTYKIATVRNSSSLQHTAMANPYTVRNFSVSEELYEILDPIRETREHPLVYTNVSPGDYRIYTIADREYEVYSNGRVIRRAYECKHTGDDRVQRFPELELKPTQNPEGYYYLNLGGRKYHERWLLHRLVAEVWLKDSYAPGFEINHKDGNKGNNSVENLEWVTREENARHKLEVLGSGRDLHSDYLSWKSSTRYDKETQDNIHLLHSLGASYDEMSEITGVNERAIGNILHGKKCKNSELFAQALYWEGVLEELNDLRDLYLQTQDYTYFFLLRQAMPMSYNYRITWSGNYQVLRRIYWARKDHKLKEWKTFTDWIETLPYAKELIIGETE